MGGCGPRNATVTPLSCGVGRPDKFSYLTPGFVDIGRNAVV
jgi:hypothetical protein